MILLLQGCGSSTRVFYGEHEKYYREQRRVNKASVITLRDDDPSPLTYRHRLRAGDELEIQLLNLPLELQFNSGSGDDILQLNNVNPIVSHDGYIYLPLIPRVYVEGKVTDEVANRITQELAKLYENPVVTVRVVNLKVFMFGIGGMGAMMMAGGGMGAGMVENMGRVLEIDVEKASLIEVLAEVGGISFVNKIKKIKIIRNYNTDKIQVIWVDLSDIEVLRDEKVYIMSDDIIFAEIKPLFKSLSMVSPYLQAINMMISASLLVINLI